MPGITARIEFTNGLLPSGSLPSGTASPLAAGAKGRLWMTGDGRFRIELQSESGDAQIVVGRRPLLDLRRVLQDRLCRRAARAQGRGQAHDERPTLANVREGLARVAEGWSLSGAQPSSTAGRPAYTVRIAPKDDGGLLGVSELAWDAVHGVPLRAAVYAQGQDGPRARAGGHRDRLRRRRRLAACRPIRPPARGWSTSTRPPDTMRRGGPRRSVA